MTYRYYDAVLVEAIHEYENVWTYRLRIADGEDTPEFTPGHYAHVAAPGLTEVTKPLRRHLSIASTPADGEFLFSMDMGSGDRSEFKQMLLDAQAGAVLKLFKIKGEFTLDSLKEGSRIIFIAGGTGITPVRSLVRHIYQEKLPFSWDLYYVGRGYLYAEELSSYNPEAHFISREGVPQMIEACAAEFSTPSENLFIYLSGSHSFVDSITRELLQKGVPAEAIRTEDFK